MNHLALDASGNEGLPEVNLSKENLEDLLKSSVRIIVIGQILNFMYNFR